MFQIRVPGAEMKRRPVDATTMNPFHVNGAALKSLRVAYALAFALGFARFASADLTEVAELVFTDSTEVAELAATDSTEVAAVIFSDDAMPRGPSVASRLAIIREKIQDTLEYPPLARLHDSDGDALVRFEIDRSGSAQNIRLVRSSGHDRLDTSAVRAIEAASPLPWVYGPLEVPVHFELTAPRGAGAR
jgi:TonB family protein